MTIRNRIKSLEILDIEMLIFVSRLRGWRKAPKYKVTE